MKSPKEAFLPNKPFVLINELSLEKKAATSLTSGELERINAIWKEKYQGLLHNSLIACVEAIEGTTLYWREVEYKQYFAKKNDLPLPIYPIGVSGLLFFKEKGELFTVVAKRSPQVTQYPSTWELAPSGSINISKSSDINPVKSLLEELDEELGVKEVQVKEFCLIWDENDEVLDIGYEIMVEKSQLLDLKLREYSSFKFISENDVENFFLENTHVPTSKWLYQAWKEKRSKL